MSPSCIADFATAFFQLREKAHVLHQKVTGSFPTARDVVRRVRRSPPLIAPRTDEQCARNLAEAIDDLYRHDAAVSSNVPFRLGSYARRKATRRATEKRCGPDG